jgi:phosphohistidine phosphatase
MEICLVRHAIAVERGTSGFENDALRPLTPRGRDRMREAAAGLATLITPQLVLTSPYLRATQTAEILAATYHLSSPKLVDALATGDDAALLNELRDLDATPVIIVGHEPYLSGTLSLLLTGDAARMSTDLKKGAAVLVSCERDPDPGSCWLEWLLQPAALRALAPKSR